MCATSKLQICGARKFPHELYVKLGPIMTKAKIHIPNEEISDFCRRHRIRRLAFFGSVLRDDFQPDSDVDVLVEFEPGTRMGMIRRIIATIH